MCASARADLPPPVHSSKGELRTSRRDAKLLRRWEPGRSRVVLPLPLDAAENFAKARRFDRVQEQAVERAGVANFRINDRFHAFVRSREEVDGWAAAPTLPQDLNVCCLPAQAVDALEVDGEQRS